MKKISIIAFLLIVCGCSNKLKSEIDKLLAEKDYLSLALLCSELKAKEFENECKLGMGKVEEEILKILSDSKDLPFSKIHVESAKRKKIEELLRKNTHLQIKYSNIWKESVYLY